jgi:hypothetical protein
VVALQAGLISYEQPEERRGSGRRTMRLQLPAVDETGARPALVYNLSQRGLLLETAAPLRPGDQLVVELPEAGATPAEVIWVRDGFAGCEFGKALPASAVSAALLRSDPRPRQGEVERAVRLEEWKGPLPAAESEWLNIVAIIALAMGLLAAALFVVALLSFPFSVQ